MPLITNTLIVGGQEPVSTKAAEAPPATVKQISKEELSPRLSFGNFINLSAPKAEERPAPIIKKAVVQEAPAPVSRYVTKHDGELVRHINTKSDYLRDIFEDF